MRPNRIGSRFNLFNLYGSTFYIVLLLAITLITGCNSSDNTVTQSSRGDLVSHVALHPGVTTTESNLVFQQLTSSGVINAAA
jgi:uncharacterized protein YcfL